MKFPLNPDVSVNDNYVVLCQQIIGISKQWLGQVKLPPGTETDELNNVLNWILHKNGTHSFLQERQFSYDFTHVHLW